MGGFDALYLLDPTLVGWDHDVDHGRDGAGVLEVCRRLVTGAMVRNGSTYLRKIGLETCTGDLDRMGRPDDLGPLNVRSGKIKRQ